MGDEITVIPQKSIVRSKTKPASPSEGLLWYDTNNDVLKQFENGSFGAVGSSPDGKTIQKNSNGELQVNQVQNKWGVWTNNLGAWNSQGINARHTSANGADGSSGCAEVLTVSVSTNYIERTLDLSQSKKLIFYYKVDVSGNGYTGTSNDVFKLIIGGDTKFTLTLGSANSQWIKVTQDISEINGSTNVKFQNENSSGTNASVGVDLVQDGKTPVFTVDKTGSGI